MSFCILTTSPETCHHAHRWKKRPGNGADGLFFTFAVDDQMKDTSKPFSGKLDSLNPTTEMDSEREPRYKNIIHLWEFLLELLAYGDECRSMIAWVREEHGEFKLKNKDEVAKKWGAYKKIKGMNYEKLSRALRHYYPKGIIKKVSLKNFLAVYYVVLCSESIKNRQNLVAYICSATESNFSYLR